MPVERSAGAVIFRSPQGSGSRNRSKGPLYLLLHYEEGHWDFPKGHIEPHEKTEETIRREVREETGITRLTLKKGFKETVRYFFMSKKKRILKFVVYSLAETPQKEIALSPEHIGHAWLSFREAREKITFPSSRKVLEKAEAYLKKRNHQSIP